MSGSSTMTDRFLQLPRAVRWLVIAALFVAAFRVWDATLGEMSREWSAKADKIEKQVMVIRDSTKIEDDIKEIEDTIISIGNVEKPGRPVDGRSALTAAIVDVFENAPHNIKQYEFDLSGGGERLPEDLSRSIVRTGYRIQKLSGTVKFETTPQKAVAIIADLEAREEIEAIRKASIVKTDSRGKETVEVSLTLESWVEVQSGKRGL